MSVAFWVCAAVTAISSFVSLGFAVAGLRGADEAARTASSYALARSLALAITATIAPFTGIAGFVAAIAVAMIVVQAADAVVGARIPDRVKTVGPAITAVANLAALLWSLAA